MSVVSMMMLRPQTVSANMSGELRLALETDEVTATTYFRDLQNNPFQDTSVISRDQDTTQSQDVLTLHEARVDVKKLSQFLQGQFNPTKAICSESEHPRLVYNTWHVRCAENCTHSYFRVRELLSIAFMNSLVCYIVHAIVCYCCGVYRYCPRKRAPSVPLLLYGVCRYCP